VWFQCLRPNNCLAGAALLSTLLLGCRGNSPAEPETQPELPVPAVALVLMADSTEHEVAVMWVMHGLAMSPVDPAQVNLRVTGPEGSVAVVPAPPPVNFGDPAGGFLVPVRAVAGATYTLEGIVAGRRVEASTTMPVTFRTVLDQDTIAVSQLDPAGTLGTGHWLDVVAEGVAAVRDLGTGGGIGVPFIPPGRIAILTIPSVMGSRTLIGQNTAAANVFLDPATLGDGVIGVFGGVIALTFVLVP